MGRHYSLRSLTDVDARNAERLAALERRLTEREQALAMQIRTLQQALVALTHEVRALRGAPPACTPTAAAGEAPAILVLPEQSGRPAA